MSSQHKRPRTSTTPVKKVAKSAAKEAGSALAVVANRLRPSPRALKHARATLTSLPSRTTRFVKRKPIRVILGASAIGFVLAKLRRLV